jgi:hypothetical protein
VSDEKRTPWLIYTTNRTRAYPVEAIPFETDARRATLRGNVRKCSPWGSTSWGRMSAGEPRTSDPERLRHKNRRFVVIWKELQP